MIGILQKNRYVLTGPMMCPITARRLMGTKYRTSMNRNTNGIMKSNPPRAIMAHTPNTGATSVVTTTYSNKSLAAGLRPAPSFTMSVEISSGDRPPVLSPCGARPRRKHRSFEYPWRIRDPMNRRSAMRVSGIVASRKIKRNQLSNAWTTSRLV
jgi:hypothetical protein